MALRAMGRPFALARRMGGHRMMCSGENPSRSTVVGGKEFLSPASTIPVPALAPLLWRFQLNWTMLTGVKDTESHRMAESLRRAGIFRPSMRVEEAAVTTHAMRLVTVPFDVRDPLEGAAQAYDVIVDHLFEKHPVDLEPLVLARDWEAFHAVADITRNTFDYEQLLRDTTMGEETHLAACRPEIDTDGPVPWVGASFYISVRLRSRGANNMPLYGAIAMTYYKARGEEEGEWLEDEGEWFVRFVNGSGTVIAA